MEKIKIYAKKMKKEIAALYIASRRSDIGIAPKLMAFIVVGYALSPIDLIPDFIPVLGYLDDLILLPLGIALTIKLIPVEVMNQCRAEADELYDNNKPKSWIAGLVIFGIWVMIIVYIFKLLT